MPGSDARLGELLRAAEEPATLVETRAEDRDPTGGDVGARAERRVRRVLQERHEPARRLGVARPRHPVPEACRRDPQPVLARAGRPRRLEGGAQVRRLGRHLVERLRLVGTPPAPVEIDRPLEHPGPVAHGRRRAPPRPRAGVRDRTRASPRSADTDRATGRTRPSTDRRARREPARCRRLRSAGRPRRLRPQTG